MLFFTSLYLLASIGQWKGEELVFIREKGAGHDYKQAYFVVKTFRELLLLRVLPTTAYCVLWYWRVGLTGYQRAITASNPSVYAR